MVYRTMWWRLRLVLLTAAACIGALPIVGCGSTGGPDGGPRISTMQVTGTVHVDGVGVSYLKVTAKPASGVGALPLDPSAMTTADGKFSLSTYESGDGVPAGEYKLIFEWGELNLMNGQYSGDKLNGKYSDPEKSEFTVTVAVGDQPKDLGTIELKSTE
jgi:hypothetical protein